MLRCKDLSSLFTEYADGNLSLWQRLRFQLHLGLCRDCRRYTSQILATAKSGDKVPEETVPQEVEEELLKRFQGMVANKNKPAVKLAPSTVILDGLSKLFRGRRGVLISLGIIAGSMLSVLFLPSSAKVPGGPSGDHGSMCIYQQLSVGITVLAVLVGISLFRRRRVAPAVFVVVATAAAWGSQLQISSVCASDPGCQHRWFMHFGGLLLVALVALFVPRRAVKQR